VTFTKYNIRSERATTSCVLNAYMATCYQWLFENELDVALLYMSLIKDRNGLISGTFFRGQDVFVDQECNAQFEEYLEELQIDWVLESVAYKLRSTECQIK